MNETSKQEESDLKRKLFGMVQKLIKIYHESNRDTLKDPEKHKHSIHPSASRCCAHDNRWKDGPKVQRRRDREISEVIPSAGRCCAT